MKFIYISNVLQAINNILKYKRMSVHGFSVDQSNQSPGLSPQRESDSSSIDGSKISQLKMQNKAYSVEQNSHLAQTPRKNKIQADLTTTKDAAHIKIQKIPNFDSDQLDQQIHNSCQGGNTKTPTTSKIKPERHEKIVTTPTYGGMYKPKAPVVPARRTTNFTVVKPQEYDSKNRKVTINTYIDQVDTDRDEVVEAQELLQLKYMEGGQALAAAVQNGQKEFFSKKVNNDDQNQDNNNRRRIEVENVMEASNDILLSPDEQGFLEQAVHAGLASYNQDEYIIGRNTTENQLDKDIDEGEISKYMLKLISEPKGITSWEQSRFENMKRAEETLKQNKKAKANDAKQLKMSQQIKERLDEENELTLDPEQQKALDQQRKIAKYYNMNVMAQKAIREAEKPTASEQEDFDEQLTGFDTTCHMAEFKARGQGKNDLADKIRDRQLDLKQLQKYLDEDNVQETVYYNHPTLPVGTSLNTSLTQDLDPSKMPRQSQVSFQQSPHTSIQQSPQSPMREQSVTSDQFGKIDMNVVKGRYTTGLDSWLAVEEGGGASKYGKGTDEEADQLLTSKLTDRMRNKKNGLSSDDSVSISDKSGHKMSGAGVMADRKETTKKAPPVYTVEKTSDIDAEAWSEKSELEALQEMKNRAQQKTPLGIIEADEPKKTGWGQDGGGDGHTKDGKTADEKICEEAVLKVVANLDSAVVSAEAMQLTQVGFIDVLRKVNQDKFLTLKRVKEHFTAKVDKVVLAKEYQIKCQRLIAIEAAKKIVSEATKDSSELFNGEVAQLMRQYEKILDLVAYFEGVVKSQSGVIAFQEKILSKLSLRLNAMKVDEDYHVRATATMRAEPGYDEKAIDATFERLPKILYQYEPFEFYGGNFQASIRDKEITMRDQIYRKQEAKIAEQKLENETLKVQIEELTWINGVTEKNFSVMNEKYLKKKQKMLEQKNRMELNYAGMEAKYENYIANIQRVLCKDHFYFKQQKEFADIQLAVSNANTEILVNRIDKYLEVAKQAKAVLRIPRLCSLYHNKIKGLTNKEQNKLLDKLYQEWYKITRVAKVKEQEENKNKLDITEETEEEDDKVVVSDGGEGASESGQDLIKASIALDKKKEKEGQKKNKGVKPLSKIEEALVLRPASHGPINLSPTQIRKKALRSLSPSEINAAPATYHNSTLSSKAKEQFDQRIFQSLDSSKLAWARRAQRDSNNTGGNGSLKPIFNFGNNLSLASSLEGSAFGALADHMKPSFLSPQNNAGGSLGFGVGRNTTQIMPQYRWNRDVAAKHHSITIPGGIGTLDEGSSQAASINQANWRKNNIMQKGQKQLAGIHEFVNLTNRGRKLARAAASAGYTQNLGDLTVEATQGQHQVIKVQVNPGNPIHQAKEKDSFGETLQLHDAKRKVLDKIKPSLLEDSMMSAGSSLDNDTILTSTIHQFGNSMLIAPPRTTGVGQTGRKKGTRQRNQKFLSNSVMATPIGKFGENTHERQTAQNWGVHQKANHTATGAKFKCPAINIQEVGRKQNCSVEPSSNKRGTPRAGNLNHMKDFLNTTALRNIETRDHKSMRAKLPAYQIFGSQDRVDGTNISPTLAQRNKPGTKLTSFVDRQFQSVATKLDSSDQLTSQTKQQHSIFMPHTSRDNEDLNVNDTSLSFRDDYGQSKATNE